MTNKHGEDKVIEDSFINDYKRTLMKEVEMNQKWGNSAKENYYFMIKKIHAIPSIKNVKKLQIVGHLHNFKFLTKKFGQF